MQNALLQIDIRQFVIKHKETGPKSSVATQGHVRHKIGSAQKFFREYF